MTQNIYNDPNNLFNDPTTLFEEAAQDMATQDTPPPVPPKVHLSYLMAILSGDIDSSNNLMNQQATDATFLKFLQDRAETIGNSWHGILVADSSDTSQKGINKFNTDQTAANAANNTAESLEKGYENIVQQDSNTLSNLKDQFSALEKIADNPIR